MPTGGCTLPARREWGWTAQLYSLRSAGDSGIGDLGTLETFARWSKGEGAAFVLVSPLHALAPGQDSPYYPTSRCFRDPTCLSGGAPSGEIGELVDRPGARRRKLEERAAAYGTGRVKDPHGFIEEGGELLRGFAAFTVLASRLGWDYREWPEELGSDPHAATRSVWKEKPDEAGFEVWLQTELDAELARVAATGCPVVNDIAVGVDPGGFDAWWWQEGVVPGASVGAPPDEFNADGQDWGVAAFDPDWLRTVDAGPLERSWAVTARHAAGLRIDHVMGLSRQYLVPRGGGPLAGEYVTYPFEDLVQKLVDISRTSGAWVVGEDLGTVEEGLRDRLQAEGILSMKVIRFEADPPSTWPERALGMASTHDLPPLAEGADRAHRELAASPCLLVAPTLEDALEVREPPNRPGIDHPHNWRRSLPVRVEDMNHDPRARATVELMRVRSSP